MFLNPNSEAIQKMTSLRSGVKLGLMKKLSLYIFLVLMWCNVGFADDIRDFEIEGISIGDSLLDYYSEEEIKNNINHYYNNKTYTPVEIKSTFFTTYKVNEF